MKSLHGERTANLPHTSPQRLNKRAKAFITRAIVKVQKAENSEQAGKEDKTKP